MDRVAQVGSMPKEKIWRDDKGGVHAVGSKSVALLLKELRDPNSVFHRKKKENGEKKKENGEKKEKPGTTYFLSHGARPHVSYM